jgi:hypothetical protein
MDLFHGTEPSLFEHPTYRSDLAALGNVFGLEFAQSVQVGRLAKSVGRPGKLLWPFVGLLQARDGPGQTGPQRRHWLIAQDPGKLGLPPPVDFDWAPKSSGSRYLDL